MFQIIHILTNFFAKILRLFVDTTVLESWKPIHLCWWFEKHNKPIPKYFIGAAGGWQTPSVTTTSATSTGISTIYCVGSNTDPHPEDRPVSARGFVWIQGTGTPTTSDNVVTVGTVGDGSFNATISDLNFNTLYSIRAYATNFAGTAYGDTITETTDSGDDLTKDLSDTITFSDNTTRERGLTKSLSDSLMFSDEFNRESIFERIIDDSINFSDVFNRESEYFRTQNDSLTFSDNTLRETSLVKQLSDMITFSDEWSSRKRPPIGLIYRKGNERIGYKDSNKAM